MALNAVTTLTETITGTTRQYRGRHDGQVILLIVGQIPADWDEVEVFQDDQNGTLYCIGRDLASENVVAHRWTQPNDNQQKVEKAVSGNDPLSVVLPTLLGDFPADTPPNFNIPVL